MHIFALLLSFSFSSLHSISVNTHRFYSAVDQNSRGIKADSAGKTGLASPFAHKGSVCTMGMFYCNLLLSDLFNFFVNVYYILCNHGCLFVLFIIMAVVHFWRSYGLL